MAKTEIVTPPDKSRVGPPSGGGAAAPKGKPARGAKKPRGDKSK